MKIEIRPEIGKSMCNCAMVKNGTDRLFGSQVADQTTSQMRNVTFREIAIFYVATVCFNFSVYYRVT